jgi:hypothetical protein
MRGYLKVPLDHVSGRGVVINMITDEEGVKVMFDSGESRIYKTGQHINL